MQTNVEPSAARIAYFSMEVALASDLPTYSGGLGVLAGDMLRAAADLRVPMVGVTQIHRKGYLDQELDQAGNQTERPAPWTPDVWTTELPARASVTIEGREVWLRASRYTVRGAQGYTVPVLLLDTDLPENDAAYRGLTDALYGGDAGYRLMQEVVLGIGGVRMLRALGYTGLERFHMNEGHAALLALELVDESARQAGRQNIEPADLERARKLCVFTTHTPVAAGHDQFPLELAERVLGRPELKHMSEIFTCEGTLNMTFSGAELEPLRERRGQASPGGVAAHVRPIPDRRDHERRARRDLGHPRVSGAIRSLDSGVARRQHVTSLRAQDTAPRRAGRAPRSQAQVVRPRPPR